MPNVIHKNKPCIICGVRKPESNFEKKGEHIVPRFLGNRKFRTPHVCSDCNGKLGGSVDIALKNVVGVTLACFDRGVGGAKSNPVSEMLDELKLNKSANDRLLEKDNMDVKGAVLKIVYEAAHLRLGNRWLNEPIAGNIRDALMAYVGKDKDTARKRMNDIAVNTVPTDVFYHAIGKSRSKLLKYAICVKSCLNGLWMIPIKTARQNCNGLSIFFDIEGLPTGYVIISEFNHNINAPELIAPLY